MISLTTFRCSNRPCPGLPVRGTPEDGTLTGQFSPVPATGCQWQRLILAFFSFTGTRGSYTISIDTFRRGSLPRCLPRRTGWEFSGSGEIESGPLRAPESGLDSQRTEIRPIPRVCVHSKRSFEDIVRKGLPVLIEGLDIGVCRSKWTLDYLAKQVGDRRVGGGVCQRQKTFYQR